MTISPPDHRRSTMVTELPRIDPIEVRIKTFWDMDPEERRALLAPDRDTPYSLRALRLAQMWADCGEDMTLMSVKYADEISSLKSETDLIMRIRYADEIAAMDDAVAIYKV